MKRTLLFLLFTLLSITLFAQCYDGEFNKRWKPEGVGTMYFNNYYRANATRERLEATFVNGFPISGKSFSYYKLDGRYRMKFEGKFTTDFKGISNLGYLNAKGNIAFYYYEEDSDYNKYGFQVEWGHYDKDRITDGYWLSAKKKQMGVIKEGQRGKAGKKGDLTPEALKYLNELDSIKNTIKNKNKRPNQKFIEQEAMIESLMNLDKGMDRWQLAGNVIEQITNIFEKNPMLCNISDKKAEQVAEYLAQKFRYDDGKRFRSRSVIDNIYKYFPEKVYNNAELKNVLFRYVAYDGEKRLGNIFEEYNRADYYKRYHDYADLSDKEILKWDDDAFNSIFMLSDVEYYMDVLPQGRHIDEVKSLYSNGTGDGLTKFQISLLDKAETDLRAYIVERTEKGRSGKFFLGDQRLADVVSTKYPTFRYKYEVESKVPFKYGAVANLLKNNSKDNNVVRKAEKILKYIAIIDGFWAMSNSMNLKKCIEENIWTGLVISPKAPVITSQFGVKVRESFEEAEDALIGFTDNATMKKLYDRIKNSHSEYSTNLKGSIQNANEKYNQYKRDGCYYEESEIDDDVLIIKLKNGDRYVFKLKDGKWKYSDGYKTSFSIVTQDFGTIDGAIKASEQANKQYWNK